MTIIAKRITIGSLVTMLISIVAIVFAVWGGGVRAGQAINIACEAKETAEEANGRSHENYATQKTIIANQNNMTKALTRIEAKLP